jgi:hypothetical protein
MRSMFAINGIKVDPQNVNCVVDMIITFCELGYGNGKDKFDCFLNYRADKDREIVRQIYWQLKAKGVHPFLDSECLLLCEEWKEGFLIGLKNSRVFVAVISRAALERPRRSDVDHRYDNVLLEYETALRMRDLIGKSNFIVPLLVGEYVEVQGKNALFKFDDFSPSLYSPSMLPVPGAIPPNDKQPDNSVASQSEALIEAWALLQDSAKCKDDDRTALAALLKDLGLSEASELEYLELNDFKKIAGSIINEFYCV